MKGSSSFFVVLVVVVVVVGMLEAKMVCGAISKSQCEEERNLAVHACMPVVYGKLPSPECCQRARVTHIECVCSVVTPKLAALVDINKAVRLIQGCGRRVPRHFKCGSIITP